MEEISIGSLTWFNFPKRESAKRRHERTDEQRILIQSLLPNQPRADHRRLINGVLQRFRAGADCRDVPERCSPLTPHSNRVVRWWKAGVWDRLLDAASKACGRNVVMIDRSCMRAHQHSAAPEKTAAMAAWDAQRLG